MNWNEFEKQIADGLNDYQSPIDVEATIEAIRKKQKRKKRIIWFLFLPLLSSVLAGFYLVNFAGLGQYQSESKLGQAIEQNISIDQSSTPELSNEESANSSNSTATSTAPIAQSETTNINSSSNNKIKKKYSAKSGSYKSLKSEGIYKSTTNLSNVQAAGNNNPDLDQSGQFNFTKFQDLETLPGLHVLLDLKPFDLTFNHFYKADKAIKLPKINNNRFIIDASMGAGIWSYNKARPLYDGADFGTDFNSREGALNVWEMGVKGSYRLKNKLFIYSGAQFVQLNRFYEYNTTKVLEETIENTYAGVNNYKSGVVDSFYANVSYVATENKYIKRYNRINTVSIPLGLSYQINFRKWSFEPFVGAQWHFYVKESLPENLINDPIYNSIEPILNPYTINRFSMEYGVNIVKNIGLKSGLFLQIRTWSFLPNTYGASEFGLNANGFSTRLGYRYKF
jgi:hypothetical protein